MELNILYITTKNSTEAKKIGRTLVDEKLSGCINVFDHMTSIYRWKEKVRESTEAVLLVKTKKTLIPRVIERVKELHSYACPCIIVLPITGGNLDYLQWLVQETI